MDQPLQSVKLAGDRAAQTSKMWVFLATPNQYSVLLTEGSLRAFQQNAVNRAAYLDTRHPLFAGEVGMWNGILVIKNERAIRFLPGESTKIVTAGNAATATETDQTVNARVSLRLCGGTRAAAWRAGAGRRLRQDQSQRHAISAGRSTGTTLKATWKSWVKWYTGT